MTDLKLAPDAANDREVRRRRAARRRRERRRALIVDFLLAAEDAEAPGAGPREAEALNLARRTLAAHLVIGGEYRSVEEAAAAADARTVPAMPRPDFNYTKVVPF